MKDHSLDSTYSYIGNKSYLNMFYQRSVASKMTELFTEHDYLSFILDRFD